jgi:putative N6-adenine-specific DNA methylase
MVNRAPRQAGGPPPYISAMPASAHRCFAVTPPGIEAITASELVALGIAPLKTEPGGVEFEATPGQLYAANLELRTATRIIVRLAEFPARAFYELERKAKRVPWEKIVGRGAPVRFRVTSRKSRLYHADAIAQRLGDVVGLERGAVATTGSGEGEAERGDDAAEETETEAQLFIVRVARDIVTISADSSGALLHRRGYRLAGAKAPLRETFAAAMLLGAGYDGTAALADPFCGSGTIPIEAALLARRIAPGRHRTFAFERWPDFDPVTWDGLTARAVARELLAAPAPIAGSDRDAGAIGAAEANAARAGVARDIVFRTEAVSAMKPPAAAGLLATNPPYGIRVGQGMDLRDLYARLGALVRDRWSGWGIAILVAGPMPEREMGLPLAPRWDSNNGGIPIRLLIRS